jgi:hypothetical protein
MDHADREKTLGDVPTETDEGLLIFPSRQKNESFFPPAATAKPGENRALLSDIFQ